MFSRIFLLFAAIILFHACSPKSPTVVTPDTVAEAETPVPIIPSAPPVGAVPYEQIRNKAELHSLRVYFPTMESILYTNDVRDIVAFVKQHEKSATWLVEGHCDERGSVPYNYQLGVERAQSVKERLVSLGVEEGNIEIVSYGKLKPEVSGSSMEDYSQNRRVVLLPEVHPLVRGLELLPGDVYLIDGSSSMKKQYRPKGFVKWDILKLYPFPEGRDVFAFNSCDGLIRVPPKSIETPDCSNSLLRRNISYSLEVTWKSLKLKNPPYRKYRCVENGLSQIEPACTTPLWSSLKKLLKSDAGYKRITVLTDGMNNHGITRSSEVIALAREKGVQISFIAIGTYAQQYLDELMKVANETQGSVHLRNQKPE